MRLLAVTLVAVTVLCDWAAALGSETEVMIDAEASVSALRNVAEMPVMRDKRLAKASINPHEVLVCTTHGCFAVPAEKIDLTQVFITTASNGQDVLVPYNNEVHPDYISGAFSTQEQLHLPEYVIRLIDFEETEEIYDQPTYELRVRAEADIMIALEALKTDIAIVQSKLVELLARGHANKEITNKRYQSTREERELMIMASQSVQARVDKVFEIANVCSRSEKTNYEIRSVLILYCQQFAFAG